MGNGMEMHIERRKTCDQGTVPKHFHPAGRHISLCFRGYQNTFILLQVNLNHQVNGKPMETMNTGLKDLDWVHGGESDAPELEDSCSDLLVIRVSESGKEHTIFID